MNHVITTMKPTLTLAAVLLWLSAFTQAGKLPAPLLDGLGDHHHRITTRSERAQRYFDQGLTLCYGFNHQEAIRSFEMAVETSPTFYAKANENLRKAKPLLKERQ